MKRMKKVFSLILSVCLIVCAVPITNATFMTMAENGGTVVDTEIYNSTRAEVEARISADNNLLKGRTLTLALAQSASETIYHYSKNYNNKFRFLTDGTLSTAHADISEGDCTYNVLVYSLGGTASVEGFELFNRNAAQNSSYEVYLSDSPNDILAEENKIYSYDGSTDISASDRCQYVQFATAKTGSYVAINLIKTYGADSSTNNFRISEIAVYGTITDANTYEVYSTNGASAYTVNNVLKGRLVERTGSSGGEEGWEAALTDGDVSNKKDLYNVGDGNTCLTWDLGCNAAIDSFIVAQYGHFATGFEYYVSNDKNTLYNEENHVATYNITEDLFPGTYSIYEEKVVFNENSKPEGRYVGVRISSLSGGETSLRVYEISAIGSKLGTEIYNSTRAEVEARISADNNLLKGRTATVAMALQTSNGKHLFSKTWANFYYLTDGTLSSGHADVSGGDRTFDALVYSLGGTALVEGFELFNRNYAQNTSYEVYLSDSPNGILAAENKIYSYDGSTDIDEANRCQYVQFSEAKTGSYIAVKLLGTYGMQTESNNYRISEIAAYGTVVDANPYEIYSTKNVSAYNENNVLKGLLVERTGSSGGVDGWDVALTDGDVSNKYDIYNVGNGNTYLTWDLGYTAVIDSFIVSQYPFFATGVEYYVSHDKATLYNAENHVATYNITDLVSEQYEPYEEKVVFNEDSKPVGRYVGVRIVDLDGESSLRIYEISAIGEAAPPELIPHNYKGFATGFEDGDSINGIGGTAYNQADSADTNVHTGSASRVHEGTEAAWLISDYTLTAYRTYNISFWYKADSASDLGYVTPSSAQNGNTFGASNGEWKQYTETVTVLEDTTVALNFYAADTAVYIDDISIVPVITVINDGVEGGNGTVSVDTVDGVLTATFTANDDFAYNLEYWVDLEGNILSEDSVYTVYNPWPGLTLKPVFEKQRIAFDFEKELDFTADGALWYTPETDGYTARYVHSGNKSIEQTVVSSETRTYTLPVDLYSGTEYEVSFRYFIQNSGSTVDASVGLNGAASTATLAYADSWQTYSCNLSATADTDRITIAFGGADAVIYIDDVCVEPTDDSGKITVSVGVCENGTGTVSDSKIVSGKPVVFTATANKDYVFDKWINANNETVSNDPVYVATGISEDTVLTPVFVRVPEATVEYGFETAVDASYSDLAVRYTPNTPYYDKANVHWGESSLRLDGYGSSYTYPVTLKAGGNYKISFWYLLRSSDIGTITIKLGNNTYNGCSANTLWYERYLNITPTEDTQLTITVSGGAGPVYIDDIRILQYHTVSIADSLNALISIPTTEPAHNDTIDIAVKKINSKGKHFYGWLKDGVVTEADSYVKEITVLEDLTIDENLIGTPVYVDTYDTDGNGKTNVLDLIHTMKKVDSNYYVVGSDVDKSGSLDANDLKAIRKTLLGIATKSERDEYFSQMNFEILDLSDGLKNLVYKKATNGLMVRETVIDSGRNDNNPVEIVQISDIHFTYANERDFAEANPTVLSTHEKLTFRKDGASAPNADRCMEYASYFNNQTVVTGDTLSYLSWGAIELLQKHIWDKDPMAMVPLGNHEMFMKCLGLVEETTSIESRYNRLTEVWRHDVYYTSRVIDNKVMVIQMDNSLNYYWDGQQTKLAADIKKARENDYTVLIFQHVPLITNNPAETSLAPIYQNDAGATNFCDGQNGLTVFPDYNSITQEVYNLITSNADVIKGVFCGHLHSDFYTEIIAKNSDGTDAVIPQYVLTGAAYDNGHVLKITVD